MNQRITGFERNESKVANLLTKLDNLPSMDSYGLKKATVEIFEELMKQLEEQEKAIKELKDRLDSHETFTPEFCRQEAEFQKETKE